MMIFMAGLIFVSCYDKDNTIHRIPDLVIENVTGGSVKTGEVIEITPKCVMSVLIIGIVIVILCWN